MIIQFVVDSKIYESFMNSLSKIADYLVGMYTEPKYIAFRNGVNFLFFFLVTRPYF